MLKLLVISPLLACGVHVEPGDASARKVDLNITSMAMRIRDGLIDSVSSVLHDKEFLRQNQTASYLEWARTEQNPAIVFAGWHNICYETPDPGTNENYEQDLRIVRIGLCAALLLNGHAGWTDGVTGTIAIPVRSDGSWNVAGLNWCLGLMHGHSWLNLVSISSVLDGPTLTGGPQGWIFPYKGSMPKRNTLLLQWPGQIGTEMMLGDGSWAAAWDMPKIRTYWETTPGTAFDDVKKLFTMDGMKDMLHSIFMEGNGGWYPFVWQGAYGNPERTAFWGLFSRLVFPFEFGSPQDDGRMKLTMQPIIKYYGRAQMCFGPEPAA